MPTDQGRCQRIFCTERGATKDKGTKHDNGPFHCLEFGADEVGDGEPESDITY